MTISTPPRGVPLPPSPEVAGTPVPTPRAPGTSTKRRSTFARPTESDDWRNAGACLSEDPELWFAPLPTARRKAVEICFAECPVRAQCYAWAEHTKQPFGIWGGVDFEASKAEVKIKPSTDEPGTDAGKEPAASAPLLERVAAVELSHPGATLAIVAELLGYKDGANLERSLYRVDKRSGGTEGKAAIRRLKPGSRNREEIQAKAIPVSGKGLTVDRDHPWLTQGALPVRKDGKNVQHIGKQARRKRSSATTGKESAA